MSADRFGSLSGGAYNAPGTVTGSNPSNFSETDPAAYPAGTGVNTNTPTRVYEPHSQAGVNQTVDPADLAPTDPPPHAPAYWPSGKDFYKNNGVTGQDFFDNQAGG